MSDALATLVQLARRARETSEKNELRFILANETYALAPYRQAALWMNGDVTTLSGVVLPEANAPYVQWLSRLFQHLSKSHQSLDLIKVSATDLPENLAHEWQEWLPSQGLWLPINNGGLLLAREEAWTEAELSILSEWIGLWSQSWQAHRLNEKSFSKGVRQLLSPMKWVWMCLAIAAMWIPVPLTVLAPAELVPIQPAVIRAPLDGVVDRILVQPNQATKQGDALFEFDRAGIQNKLQVAQRSLDTLQAEYRQKAQLALIDPINRAQLAPLQGQIAEKNAEVHYLHQIVERGVATSPRDGIALFDDPTEWIGKPVVTGEKIMMIADPHHVEIEAWLAPSDAIQIKKGAPARLFLNADPTRPVLANLSFISHEATERPDGSYAYRIRALLSDPKKAPRLGLKGIIKLEGEKVTLGYWMFRRPWSALRTHLGI